MTASFCWNFFKKLDQEKAESNDKDIKMLADSVATIQPTSVNPERAFSIAGFFCSKIRSRMGSDLLGALVLLKYNFINYI